ILVVTPEITWPPATPPSTRSRDSPTARRIFGSSATDTLRRATAMTSAMVSDRPSRVTVPAMGTKAKAPEWQLPTPAPRLIALLFRARNDRARWQRCHDAGSNQDDR